MKKIWKSYFLILGLFLLIQSGCSDYLDVIPDNIPTIDHAFTNRINAETYLFTCYSYLPNPTAHNNSPSLISPAEFYTPHEGQAMSYVINSNLSEYLRGNQNSNSPYLNYWDGANNGTNLFIAIRDCNIFMENIHKPIDLEEWERDRWVAEVKFLKAYYHFFLLRMYGPIPIIRENLEVSAPVDVVRVYRDPVDEVVAYIVELLDEAIEHLPQEIFNPTEELGRITIPIAKSLKAQTLVLAASPVFNGNPYYRNMRDNRGQLLFSQEEDNEKWVYAADALKDAIESAHEAGHQLYYYRGFNPITDSTKVKLNTRGAVTDRWNEEIIWGSTRNSNDVQKHSMTRTNPDQLREGPTAGFAPTLAAVERFYSDNGVPIDEDLDYDYEGRYNTRKARFEDRFYIKEGFETANLHFEREPRFYASVSFDGCAHYGNGVVSDQPNSLDYYEFKKGRPGGMIGSEKYSVTGYLPQKLVNIQTTLSTNGFTYYRYSFPYLRLADLYLLYSEALNEIKNEPDQEVYFWIDEVRKRASLDGVVDSWKNHSVRPDKPFTKSGMREIIKQERMIELAFEGQTFWDLIRWKDAENIMNKPIQGWNIRGADTEEFYQIKTIAIHEFSIKHYLSPIRQSTLDRNSNLIQNFGWGGSN